MVTVWRPAEAIAKLQAEYSGKWYNLRVSDENYRNLRVAVSAGDNYSQVGVPAGDSEPHNIARLHTFTLIYGYNGSSWDRLRALSDSDGISNTLGSLAIISKLYGYNGSTFDRLRTHYDSGDITVTATGTTSTIDTVTGFDKHTWTVVSNASSSNLTVKLEGSLDNSNWFELDSYSGTANTMRHAVNKPVRYIRFNITSMGDATSITLRYFGMR